MMKVRSQLEEKKALKSPNSNIEYRSVEKWSCAYALDKNELYPAGVTLQYLASTLLFFLPLFEYR